MSELTFRQRSWLAHDVLDDFCQKHDCNFWGKQIPNGNYLRFCPSCQAEQTEVENQKRIVDNLKEIERFTKYDMLERESIISPELKLASFDSFGVVSQAEEEGLEFAKRATRHYYDGGIGNVVISGKPGLGKSHLALSMLRALNEAHGKKEKYRSAVFMPVTRLFNLITDSFNNPDGLTEARAVALLRDCDYLVLDDLGKESSYSHELKRANDWKQSVLFNILEGRERTIITTNFTPEQLAYIYDPALYDRLLRGDRALKIRFDETMISKR